MCSPPSHNISTPSRRPITSMALSDVVTDPDRVRRLGEDVLTRFR